MRNWTQKHIEELISTTPGSGQGSGVLRTTQIDSTNSSYTVEYNTGSHPNATTVTILLPHNGILSLSLYLPDQVMSFIQETITPDQNTAIFPVPSIYEHTIGIEIPDETGQVYFDMFALPPMSSHSFLLPMAEFRIIISSDYSPSVFTLDASKISIYNMFVTG